MQDLEGEGPGEAVQQQRQQQVEPLLSTPSLSLEPLPSSPQQDPRWTPLEDMEVFSPDEEAVDAKGGGAGSQSTDQSEGLCVCVSVCLRWTVGSSDCPAAADFLLPVGGSCVVQQVATPLPPCCSVSSLYRHSC